MTLADEQFDSWAEWFRNLTDEVNHLLISRETLKQVGEYLSAKRDSYDPIALLWFKEWLGSMWGVAIPTRIRALGDTRHKTKSLRRLLGKVEGHPEVFTRERYVKLSSAGDPYTRERASREFTARFGPGEAIDPAGVHADIAALDLAVAEVKKFVDKRIAHLDPKWSEMSLTFAPVYAALDVVGDLVKKYSPLFTGQFPSLHFGELRQFEARQIFEPSLKNPR
jgi:hypothetical protein